MTKGSGLGDNLYVDGYDLSGDTQMLSSIHGGPAALDMTAINKSAYERQGGLRDGGIDWASFLNDAAGQAHPVLSGLPVTDRIVTYCRGTTLGNPAASMQGKQIGYDPNRDNAGNLTFTLNAQSNAFGLEWGKLMTAGKRTDTVATNGTGVDFGYQTAGTTAFGLQAYLHVFAFTGTSVTIKLQESSDNGSVDPFADTTSGAFAVVGSAPQAQRIGTSLTQNVKRYLRVVTTGTFSSVTFAVMVNRNDTLTAF